MTDDEAEAITNLAALLTSANEVIAEQLEIRKRLEAENAALKKALRRIATVDEDGLAEYTPQAMVAQAAAALKEIE